MMMNAINNVRTTLTNLLVRVPVLRSGGNTDHSNDDCGGLHVFDFVDMKERERESVCVEDKSD